VVANNPSEIIAVDARSTDDTIKILRNYDATILIDIVGSMGFSRQLGVEAARFEYVVFVDSDAVLTPHCIDIMIGDLELNGWVGCQASDRSAEDISYWQKAYQNNEFYNPGSVKVIATRASVFKREILLNHPFDPNMRESQENVELCIRLIKNGYTLGLSDAIAYHYHRKEFAAFVKQRIGYGVGTVRLARKHHDRKYLASPLIMPFSLTIRSLPTPSNIRWLPYWVVDGLARFTGILIGFQKTKKPEPTNSRTRESFTASSYREMKSLES